jgi:long-chain acyl-CoA synthetase
VALNSGHIISTAEAVTLDGLFRERVRLTPDAVAYRGFNLQHANWRDYTWAHIDHQVARWQAALERDGIKPGDRVGVMLRNSPEWVIFDQAALGLGLIVVPLYTQDRPDNVAYILNDAGCKALLFGTLEQWIAFAGVRDQLGGLIRILMVEPMAGPGDDPRLQSIDQWLPENGGETRHVPRDPAVLATIVYTSGTTGRPKGVMLSHRNLVSNAAACLQAVPVGFDDVLLSFLPLSHTFERTCGYYLAIMCGATTVYARSVQQLGDDLRTVRPTMLISVPRIYERVYAAIKAKLDDGPPLRKKLFELTVDVGWARFEHEQGRMGWTPGLLLWPVLKVLVASKIMARLGGKLKSAFAGGAALSPDISRVFIGLGLPVIQGYGLTETSPVACANRLGDNLPASVGRAVAGVEVRIGDRGALMIKGPNVMLGYWNNPEATSATIDAGGWFNSGDTARIDADGHVFITGRLKEIVVLSNGEKIPPVDIEIAIMRDPLFEQVMLIGEGRAFLSLMRQFPGYAQVRRITATLDPWTVENGLLTPTMKLRRSRVLERFNAELDRMYSGH